MGGFHWIWIVMEKLLVKWVPLGFWNILKWAQEIWDDKINSFEIWKWISSVRVLAIMLIIFQIFWGLKMEICNLYCGKVIIQH